MRGVPLQRSPYVLVISGPSGAGKSTFVQSLLQAHPQELHFSVSATTRQRRGREQDGRDYHFLTDAVFDERLAADDFLEWAEVHGCRYGTLHSEVEQALRQGRSVLLDVDVQGGLQIKRRLPEAVLVFLLPPSLEDLEERLRARNTDSPETIDRRMKKAPDEIRSLRQYDYVVVNDSVDDTRSKLEAIYVAEGLRRHRLRSEAGVDFVEEYLESRERLKGT
jgi:guanylate kinase